MNQDQYIKQFYRSERGKNEDQYIRQFYRKERVRMRISI
jgi:hypothetical protein